MGRGNESLFVKSGLHDQDGRHAHIWLKPLIYERGSNQNGKILSQTMGGGGPTPSKNPKITIFR